MNKRKIIKKDFNDGKILGICKGISNYLNVDPFFIRITFVILFFLRFRFIFLYLLLGLLLENEDDHYEL